MGEIVLAATCAHVASMLMPEQEGAVNGRYQAAMGDHLPASAFPQFNQKMPGRHEGNPAICVAAAGESTDRSVHTLVHHPESPEPDCRMPEPRRITSCAHDMVRPMSSFPLNRRQ